MTLTQAMIERAEFLGAPWCDEGGGYYSMSTAGPCTGDVAYVAIPESHPFCGRSYHDLLNDGPNVNGGLTFGDGNVFGWDYGHAFNDGSPKADILRALAYFRAADIPEADYEIVDSPVALLSNHEVSQ